MADKSEATTVRNIVHALYLQSELTIRTDDGLAKVKQAPSKQQVYRMARAIFSGATPSQSTIYRWLNNLEKEQPALVACSRKKYVEAEAYHSYKIPQNLPSTTPATWSKEVQEHREAQARSVAALREQHQQIIQVLTTLEGQIVLDATTGEAYLYQGQEAKGDTSTAPTVRTVTSQEPRQLTYHRPHGAGVVERVFNLTALKDDA